MDKEEYKSFGGEPDQFEGYAVYGSAYPTAEEALFRMAIDRTLTQLQKEIWEHWNYDKMTQREIGKRLNKSQQAIEQQIRTIEKHLTDWCGEHMEVYNLLKEIEG